MTASGDSTSTRCRRCGLAPGLCICTDRGPSPDTDRADLEKMFERAGVEYEVLEQLDFDEVKIVVMDRYNELAVTAICVCSGDGRGAGYDGLSTVYAFDAQGGLIDTWAWSES